MHPRVYTPIAIVAEGKNKHVQALPYKYTANKYEVGAAGVQIKWFWGHFRPTMGIVIELAGFIGRICRRSTQYRYHNEYHQMKLSLNRYIIHIQQQLEIKYI